MDQPSPGDIRKFRRAGERRNFAYRKVEVLQGGVGWLQVDGFYPAEYVREIVAGAAGFLSHTFWRCVACWHGHRMTQREKRT